MENKITKLLSAVFHPLLIPTYSYTLLLNLKTYFALIISTYAKFMIIGFIFIVTFIFPMIFTFFLYKRGLIKSFYMKSREERTIPYVITAVFFYIAYYMLQKLSLSPVFSFFMAGATFLLVLNLLINLFWKISSHMIAMGAIVGGVIGLSILFFLNLNTLIIAVVLISGLVAYARLQSGAHTPVQVYTGFFLGAVTMGSFIYYLN